MHKKKLEKRISGNNAKALLTHIAWVKWVFFFIFDRERLAGSIGARHEPATEDDPPLDWREAFRMVEATMTPNAKEFMSLVKEMGGLSVETGDEAESCETASDTAPAACITANGVHNGRSTDLDELNLNDLLHTDNDATSTPELEALWRNYVCSNTETPHG